MKILVEVTHPAHVHFFRNPLRIWAEQGHELKITSRKKDCTTRLLDQLGIEHEVLSSQGSNGILGMVRELTVRNRRLFQVVRRFQPDVLCAVGGIWAAQVGVAARRPSVVFYNTEEARLQNYLTYPFASRVCVAQCYTGWTPRHRTVRYRGYHELSYLDKKSFTPNRDIAIKNGLSQTQRSFLVRTVAWAASHDIGLDGWSETTLRAVVAHLARCGQVFISSERRLPPDLESYRYKGEADQLHHLLAFCSLYVGESATIASEAVVLGVPAVYAAPSYRGYVSDQEARYGLARFVPAPDADSTLAAIDDLLAVPQGQIRIDHARMLRESEDIAEMICSNVVSAAIEAT